MNSKVLSILYAKTKNTAKIIACVIAPMALFIRDETAGFGENGG